MTSTDDRAPCPYVGLQPFQERDRAFFFGRERDQRIIISNLLASPLTILYGSSGVGKSSVLMAGVVPQLRRDRPRNPVIVFRTWVGEDFQLALARACVEEVWKNDVGQPKPAVTLPFDEVLRACSEAAHETILVLFDQFEEYFLYHAKSADPESFEAQFARAVNREDVDIGFLIALREDGLSKLDRFQERIPGLLSNRLRLKHLDETGAAAAIRSPLDVWNSQYAAGQPPVTIEEDLVAQLIEQVKIGRVAVGRQGGSGATQEAEQFIEAPFLQLVMTRLWKEEMAAGSRRLRLDTLVRLKGAKEIVRTHLDDVMAALDATSQAVCASFFDRLVTPSGSKVACARDDLAVFAGKQLAPHVPAVLQTLSHNAILRTVAASPDNPEATSYEIYHDVLAPAIVDWRLRYVEGQQRALAVQEAREQAAKRAVRKWLAALAVMTAIAVAGWVYASWERMRAEANQKAAESIATSPFDAKRGLDLALAAVDRTSRFGLSPTVSAEDALDQAIQASTLEWSLHREGRVWAVAFSPDGRRLAVGDGDKSVTIWEMVAGAPRWTEARTFSAPDSVRAVAFLPSGDRLATAGGDTARLWEVEPAATERVQFKQGSDIESALAVSADGRRLATAGGGKRDRTIKVWDTETGGPEPIATIDMAGAWVKGLTFSPDGCCLATANAERGSASRTFSEVWNVNTSTRILRVPNPVPSDAVAFTPDGKSLVTAGRDGRVRVWRPAVGALDEVLADRSATTADTTCPATVAETVASLSTPIEPSDIPWNVRVLAGHLERVRNLAVSHDGSRIASASADHSVILWDAETGEHLRTLAGHGDFVEAVAFSADGQQLVTGGRDKTMKMWNIAGHGAGVYSIAFSPDGATLATASGEQTTKLWDLSSGIPRWRHTLRGHTDKVYRLAFDPTGGRLVTAAFDNTAKLWDVASGALLRTLTGHKDQLRNVAYSPDGKRIATVSADGTALLYRLDDPDAAPTRVTHNAEKPTTQAAAVAFHPSRPQWATGGWDGMLQLWDFDGKHVGTIAHPAAGSGNTLIVDVAFSRDGAEIAALAIDGVYFWSVAGPGQTMPRVITIPYCDSLEYSPDGQQLAVACPDGGVRIYDPKTRALLKTVTVHQAAVSDAAFSLDGTWLATASLDKTFHISPLRFDELYKVATRLQAAMSDEK